MTKQDKYTATLREIDIRLEKGGDLIADLGNIVAILKKRHAYFWIGFYFLKENKLVLGPFQGPPACVFLEKGKGVCWASALRKETVLVANVHEFADHIACNPNSKSEIVVPCLSDDDTVQAVLDLDHDEFDTFDEVDQKNLELLAEKISSLW